MFIQRFLLGILPIISTCILAESPDCESWPTNMAFVHLKNAGITTNDLIEFDKTEVVKLLSGLDRYDEQHNINIHRQIHRITFHEKTGKEITVITVNDASVVECSMSGVEVYVVTDKLGGR
ncbi:MAG: hypothetical protein AB2535_22180 [Candidatus Thiodiazotropha endolucinida]